VTPNPLKDLLNNRMVVVVSAIALSVLGLSAYLMMNPIGDKPKAAEQANQSTDKSPVGGIGALGRLEPEGEVFKVAAPATGLSARVLGLKVKEGDVVRAGQEVAIMDSAPSLQAAGIQAEAQVREAQAKLAQIKAGSKPGDIGAQGATFLQTENLLNQAEAARQQATAGLLSAQAELNKRQWELERVQALCAAKSPQDATNAARRVQEPLLSGATDSQTLQSKLKTQVNLVCNNGAVSEAEVRSRLLAVETQQAQVLQAKRLEDERSQVVEKNKLDIAKERERLNSVKEVRPEDILAAEQAVQVALANLRKAEADFNNAIVRSPTDGKVLKIHAKGNESVGTNGIMEIGKTNQMYAVAEVDENLIGRVKPGQRAVVRSDAFQGEIGGKVVAIGSKVGKNRITSTDPADSQDSRVVEVKIQLDSSEVVAGLTNLQVKVAIQP
jgi:HlyD family secretion protein